MQALLALLLLLPTGCVEPYAPDVIDAPPSLLVVEGFINADGPTTIRLSRTAALSATATPLPETKARVFIELKNNFQYSLTETAPGTYTSVALKLPAGSSCRLRIVTAKNQEYASDFVSVKLTPPIDELRWTPDNNTVNVLLSTHDDTRASQYYRWDFDETWQISSPYSPSVEYYNRAVTPIRTFYPIFCWGNNQSSRILLSKTTALSQDAVTGFRVQGIAANNPQLHIRYSILVRQRALSEREYDYWEELKKNTESVGSLFDPQPSQSQGNIRGLTNPDEQVLGFVGANSIAEKRLFIERQDLPDGWKPRSGYEDCIPPDSVFIVARFPDRRLVDPQGVIDRAFGSMQVLPIDPVLEAEIVVGYTAKNRDCIDCRTRGTDVRPSFW
ncbi:DUF4249 domain-containing protein [Hymenobacter lapidiphilus]|nr:DUF4249 domain-containing protein [Hymenobacter sp. CCM 8763]